MEGFIIAIVFVFFGIMIRFFPPKKNGIYGYRTPLSMKNNDTWEVGQKIGGTSSMVLGIVIFVASILLNLMYGRVEEETIVIILLIGAILMIVYDEVYLRRIFNKDGSRKIN